MEITQEMYFRITVELAEEGFIQQLGIPSDALEAYLINYAGWERFGLTKSDWKPAHLMAFSKPPMHLKLIKNVELKDYLKKLYSGDNVSKAKATLLTAIYTNGVLNP